MKEYSYIKRALLRELSENSRASVTNLSKKLKCSRNTIVSNMKKLEREFDLYYTLDLDKGILGFVQNHVWSVKFGTRPDLDTMKALFADDDFVQFVATTDGDFDLLIRTVSDSSDEYVKWSLKTINKFLPYRPVIKPSFEALTHTGFVPILNTTLKKLDLTRLGINAMDKKIIMLLNNNSRLSYMEMAKKLEVDVSTIGYRVKKLLKSELIRRFTITMKKQPTHYNVTFFVNYQLAPGVFKRYEDAHNYYVNSDGKLPLVNKFSYLAFTSGSYLLFGIGCFDSEEKAIKETVIAHKEIYKEDNPEVYYARINEVIKGYLPIRNIDIANGYRTMDWKQN
jgi:DNA-binding Lrp family transcriptional regulator